MQERPTGKNLTVYASLSTMRQEPSQSEMNNGVIPLDTLPAAWWNWMWNAITQAQNDSMHNDDILFTEINNVLTVAGITPGTSSQHDQLRQAIAVIKGAIATTAEAGSVLSTDSGTTGTVKVAADGKMAVNNFGDIASFHGATKDNLMGALNETYDIAYGSNNSIGELSALTTAAKDTLVDAINEMDAGKAPTMHASPETTHGIGNADNYGHVKLTDTPGFDDATSGTAATPKLVQDIVSGGLGAVNAVSYTFIVDSNEKLVQWANNNKASGQDYTSVLIRKGEWTSSKAVNLTPAGTKVVVGEPGSKLVFNNTEEGLYYGTRHPNTPDYYMRGVTVTVTAGSGTVGAFRLCTNLTNCSGSGSGASFGYGFYKCTNLTNCSGSGSGAGSGDGFISCTNLTNCSGTGYGPGDSSSYCYGFDSCTNLTNCSGTGYGSRNVCGFYTCTNLTNCSGTSTGGSGSSYCYGFYKCTNLTNCSGTSTGVSGSGYCYGFHSCTNLTNCSGSGTGYGDNSSYGFHSCNVVIGCRAGDHCKTAVFQDCYASSSKTSTYACADTANGGFNNTTNPAA